MRTVLGVIVGYLVFGICGFLIFELTGHDPHPTRVPVTVAFMVGSTIAGMFAALAGGYVAAKLSGKQLASALVALIITVGAVVSAAFMRGALWSNIAAAVLMAPTATLGGQVAKKR